MCINYLNTPRRVEDETNNIVWKWESTPFGETKPTGTLEFNLRFAGQYFDNETATHYNINRDYNPITGRYIESDPIGLDGGFSTFAYVNGNPIMFVDLEGLCSQVKPTPVFVDRTNLYMKMIAKFRKDLNKAYSVADDIRNTIKFTLGYDSSVYSSSSPGYESRAQATGIKKGISGTITFYRSTWENRDGSLLFNYKGEFIYVIFHELQHLRKTNNGHSYPMNPNSPFQTEANAQALNFIQYADSYWGSE